MESLSFSLCFLPFPPPALSTTMGSLPLYSSSLQSITNICLTDSLTWCRAYCLITVILIEINGRILDWLWPGATGRWIIMVCFLRCSFYTCLSPSEFYWRKGKFPTKKVVSDASVMHTVQFKASFSVLYAEWHAAVFTCQIGGYTVCVWVIWAPTNSTFYGSKIWKVREIQICTNMTACLPCLQF